MSLRNLDKVSYIPLLALRPAEMQALEELPDRDKHLLMPYFQLGPWTTAQQLSSSLSRLKAVYGERPCFLCVAEAEPGHGTRPVHQELAALRDPRFGYKAWCSFVQNQPTFVPALQLSDPDELAQQALQLHELDRGLLVALEREAFRFIERIASTVGRITSGGTNVCFFLDFGRGNRDILLMQGMTIEYIRSILRKAPNAKVAISASSFPDTFVSIDHQEIFERAFFNGVSVHFSGQVIYSDRGSARAERQTGGGSIPAPRIDYPKDSEWRFFRSNNVGPEAYFEQAQEAMVSGQWDPRLRIWGTQMIERTALSDHSAIISAKRATAARINIHLHRQLFYGDEIGLYETDDPWED